MSSDLPTGGHLSAQLLDELARGERTAPEVLDRGLAHLAALCPTCRERLGEYGASWGPREPSRGLEVPAAALARAQERLVDVAGELSEAPGRVSELLSTASLPRALGVVAFNPRLSTWGVAAHLIERARAGLDDAPRAAYRTALLAASASGHVPVERYGRGVAQAGALLASASTITRDDLPVAETLLAAANGVARSASDPSLVRAELALSRMRLDLAAGTWDRAFRAHGQVERQTSEGGLAGHRLRGLLLLGRVLRAQGERRQALGTFRVLVQFAQASPAAEALARWGALEAAKTLSEMGRFDDALAQIDHAARRSTAPTARRWHALAGWVRGRALGGLGRTGAGVEALEGAWRALAAVGVGLEPLAAVVDLVELYVRASRPAEVTRLLERASRLHRASGLPRRGILVVGRLQAMAARGEIGSSGHLAVEALLKARPAPAALSRRIH
jgi:tetratricopeptide (TPR) repeat protein